MHVLALIVEARGADRSPSVLRLCLADEIQLFDGAHDTLGLDAAEAARAGADAWRTYLANWMRDRAGLQIEFDADETTVE